MKHASRGTKATTKKNKRSVNKLKIKYARSPAYRAIHANGVWGGVSPAGTIDLNFWNEGSTLPMETTLVIQDDRMVEEKEVRSPEPITREVDVRVSMNLELAKSVMKWLEQKISIAEGLHSQKKKEAAG